MAQKFAWVISNVDDFRERLDRLAKVSQDFTIPFKIISSDFYRSQKQLFMLQSAGMYDDLSTKPFIAKWQNKRKYGALYSGGYKEYKQVNLGFTYPILVGATKVLATSTLGPKNLYSKWSLNSKQLTIGSSVPYGKYHQSDEPRKKIPQRKFIFIDGGKGDTSKGSGINGRRERWLSIIDEHIKQLLEGVA